MLVLVANFDCICSKNSSFSNMLQKVKSNFLQISINLNIESHQVFKIEGPYWTPVNVE
jgi:hypothetical protein